MFLAFLFLIVIGNLFYLRTSLSLSLRRIHVASSLTVLPKETLGKLVLELFSVLHMTTVCFSICARVWGPPLTTSLSIELSFLVSSLLFSKALGMSASKEILCLSVCRSALLSIFFIVPIHTISSNCLGAGSR